MSNQPVVAPTFDTVETELPPPVEATDADLVIDPNLTFLDVEENGGKYPVELPVEGSVDRVPNVQAVIKLLNAKDCLTMATWDSHVAGHNPTVVTSFDGIAPNTWVTVEMAQSWLGAGNSPIKPDAGFTAEQYVQWVEMLTAGGAMVWNGHGNPLSPLYTIHPVIFRALTENPNLQIVKKGSQTSRIIRNFCPESYSAAKMSTGESLGMIEFLQARGIKRVYVVGYCGDFCAGETAFDLVNAGFEVWLVVDAQASVKVPNYAGTDLSSEQHMVHRLTAAGVRFCTTADMMAVNGYAVQSV
jgi:nicotinamidase-related amidase